MTSHKIGIIVSSSRPTRIGPKVAQWVSERAPQGVDVEIIDLADVNLPFLAEPKLPAEGDYTLDSTKAWSAKISEFDGLVLAVPEYNAGYPAVLKNAIDTLHAEWNGLPIGVVGYGWGGAASATAQLGQVLDRVQAVRLDGPALKFGEDLGPDGVFLEAADEAGVRGLLEQVVAAAREQTAA